MVYVSKARTAQAEYGNIIWNFKKTSDSHYEIYENNSLIGELKNFGQFSFSAKANKRLILHGVEKYTWKSDFFPVRHGWYVNNILKASVDIAGSFRTDSKELNTELILLSVLSAYLDRESYSTMVLAS